MTEKELEHVRLSIRVLVLETLFAALFRKLAQDDFQFFRWKASLFEEAIEKAQYQTIPGATPEIADLVAAEYQEALKDLIKSIDED